MATASIVGAGVGGLTAALCLARAGWQVSVYERAARIEGVGAGLQISPNASRVLIHLGLEPALQAVAFSPQAIEMRDAITSRQLARTELDGRWGAPYWHLHRGDLVHVLLDAVRSSGEISLSLNTEITDVDSLAGNLVVGADGIHSAVRRQLFANETAERAPRFTGNVAYRGLVSADAVDSDLVAPVATARLGAGAHFVHYYVRSGELVNCVAVVEQSDWQNESWVEPASIDSLRRAFGGWAAPVPALIDAMAPDSVFRWALFDREPMKQWHRGRVTLLGDACHATLPFMAQGAAMAIEDAALLAQVVSTDDVAQGLRRYEALRRPRTTFVQQASRRNATVYHLSGLAARARNLVLPVAGRQTMNRLYGYDVFAAGTDPRR